MKHTISVLVENQAGVLARIAGLFARRGFNIDSLAVGVTDDVNVSRITIVADGSDYTLEQIEKQLNKLKRQPIIVIICEGLDACKELNSRIEHIYPGVRKLFTFDSLLMSEEAFTGAGNYFEFTNGVPHSLKLEDVL